MHHPFQFWLGMLVAIFFGAMSVQFGVRAIRSQGRGRRLNMLASVACILTCCALIALNVWLWLILRR